MRLTTIALFALMAAILMVSMSIAQDVPPRTLVKERCTRCHTLDRVKARIGVLDSGGWSEVVKRMIERKANLTPEQGDKVAAYLTGLSSPDGL